MSLLYPVLPGGSRLLLIDGLVVLWAVAWIVVGLAVGRNIEGLATLSDTVRTSGVAVAQAASVIHAVASIPGAPGDLKQTEQQVREAGLSAQRSGRSSRDNIDQLSWLLGFAIALIPIAIVLAVYGPVRLGRIRERGAISSALRRHRGDPAFEEYLARRAVNRLPYQELLRFSSNPWRDIEAGNFGRLAEAELLRLGVKRSRGRPVGG